MKTFNQKLTVLRESQEEVLGRKNSGRRSKAMPKMSVKIKYLQSTLTPRG